ncbi:hypothetical protein BH11PSE11_BH11PSE11_07710 [soil metagenome]
MSRSVLQPNIIVARIGTEVSAASEGVRPLSQWDKTWRHRKVRPKARMLKKLRAFLLAEFWEEENARRSKENH